jgi:hypothetical protein
VEKAGRKFINHDGTTTRRTTTQENAFEEIFLPHFFLVLCVLRAFVVKSD